MKKFIITSLIIFLSCGQSKSQITQEWAKSYILPGNSTQTANDVVTDQNGNVYMTGSTGKGYSGADMILVKYNSSGVYQWTRTYNYPSAAYSNENGKTITTYSNAGKNYVIASGEVNYGGYTQIVISTCYDEDGNLKWIRGAYLTPFGFNLTLNKIIADASGNCYITGSTGRDVFLLKYDSTGIQKFSVTFTNPSGYHTGIGHDIKLDASGNIFITGQINNGSVNKFLLLKYDNNGNLQWSKILQSVSNPGAFNSRLVIGNSGNIYVTGTIAIGNHDIFTIKYNSSGDTLWTRRYNGTENSNDYVNAIVMDASENIYFTGLVNGLYGDVATVKYDSAGVLKWIKTFAGPNGWADEGKDLSLDAAGNIYVTGYLEFSVGQKFLTLKYNANGDLIWSRDFNFKPTDYESAVAISIDNSGNVVAAGSSGYTTICDFSCIKYDSSGNQLWNRTFNGAEISTDAVNSIAIDKNGNVYAIGKIRVSGLGDNIYLVKYNQAGVQKWVYERGGVNVDIEDAGNAVCTDVSGSVYFTGTMYNGTTQERDVYTMKLDSNGAAQWNIHTHSYGGSLNDEGVEIGTDSAGNVYAGFNSESSSTNKNIGVLKYNSAGTLVWNYGYSGTANDTDVIRDMKVDKNGNVFILANSKVTGEGINILTIKLNSAGTASWVKSYNGSANGNDDARSIDTDNNGNVYITGCAYNTGTGSDLVVIKYLPDGTQGWVITKSQGANLKETGAVLKYDSISSKIVVAGDLQASTYPDKVHMNIIRLDTSGSTNPLGSILNPSNTSNNNVIGGGLDAAGYLISASQRESSNQGYNERIWREAIHFIDFNGSSSGNDIPAKNNSIAAGVNFFYAGVSTYDSAEGYTMSIVKYKSPVYTINLNMFIQGFYDPIYNYMNVYDTVKVTLRNTSPPYSIIDSAKSYCTFEGNAYNNHFFKISGSGQYYVVVNHRNSVETWSRTPLTFGPGFLSPDFTDTANVFGGNLISVDNSPQEFGLYSGDVNQDGFIDLTDVININNDANSFATGYINTDLTGNNVTDLTDVIMAYNNSVNFVSIKKPLF